MADNSTLTIWSLYDKKFLGKICYEKIDQIEVSNKYIFISTNNKLCIYPNPFCENSSQSLLVPEKYSQKYWSALREIITNPKSKKYLIDLNSCVILPQVCNVLHLFTHQLNIICIKLAFRNGCDFIRTIKMRSPITIAIENKTGNIIDHLVKEVGILLEKDPNTFYRTENDLIMLNKIGSSKLNNLYESALVGSTQSNLPKFGCPLKKGFNVLVSSTNHIEVLKFIKKVVNINSSRDIESMKTLIISQNTDNVNNIPIDFQVSAMRIPAALGSRESIEFLQSLIETENKSILTTSIIRSLILYKYDKIFL